MKKYAPHCLGISGREVGQVTHDIDPQIILNDIVFEKGKDMSIVKGIDPEKTSCITSSLFFPMGFLYVIQIAIWLSSYKGLEGWEACPSMSNSPLIFIVVSY